MARATDAPSRHEQGLLLEALFLRERPRPRLAALARGEVAWPRLLRHARDRGVLGTLACSLLAEGLSCQLGEVEDELRAAYEAATAQNAQLLHELGRVQAALGAAGVESVALKGTALLARHYPALGARHADDIDLLVSPGMEGVAAHTLLASGYAPRRPLGLDRSGRPTRLDVVPAADHHLPTLVGAAGVPCELHVRLPGGASGSSVEPLFARALDARFGGAILRVAAPVDLLAIACQHVVVGHSADPRFLLRHLADLHVVLATSDASWEEARTLHPGARAAIEVSLRMLRDAGRPGGRGRAVGRVRAASPAGPWPLLARGRALARRLAVGWRRSPVEAARMVFPARAFMAERHGVGERSALLPLFYLLRALRTARRVVTGR